MRIWGITGTNGKTTTVWMLAEIFRAAARPAAYVTTVEADTLVRRFHTGYTTPPLPALLDIFAEAQRAGALELTMEVSSHAISQHRTGDTVFAGGAFTNLTQDHLDYHGTMEAYYLAKEAFFRRLAAANPGAPAAICLDCSYGRRLAGICRKGALDVIGFGQADDADVRVSGIEVTAEGSNFDFCAPRFGIPRQRLRVAIAGAYNVLNVACASSLALAAGIPARAVLAAVERFRPRWGRLERVECASKAAVFVDFAHTDDALANVLSTVRAFTSGKVWAVFGAGGDRDRAKRPKMGRAAAENADFLVVTSDNPRSEPPAEIAGEILCGVPEEAKRTGRVLVELDRRAAIRLALSRAGAGDSVVICGKGHETVQIVGGEELPFDDRKEAAAFSAG